MMTPLKRILWMTERHFWTRAVQLLSQTDAMIALCE